METDVCEEDIYRYVLYQLWHDRFSRWRLGAAYVLTVALAVYLVAEVLPLAAALVFGVLVAAAAPWAYRKYLRRTVHGQVRSNPIGCGPSRYSISSEGVFEETPGALAASRWATFQRIEATQQYFFFYHDGEAGIIVPRRCFTTPEEAEVFLRDARAWHTDALRRNHPAPTA